MAKKPEKFEKTIVFLADLLKDHQYAFRGTASLVLQGLEMNVADIDVLADKRTALICNQILEKFLLEPVEYKESEKFKSYFGRFEINAIPVEIMGEWRIKDSQGNWSQTFNASERMKIIFQKKQIWLTSFETELAVFAKMGRWSVYHKIRKQVREKEQGKLF